MDTSLQDIGVGARMLFKSAGFTAVVSQPLFGKASVLATQRPPRGETKFRRQVRSQTEFWKEVAGELEALTQ